MENFNKEEQEIWDKLDAIHKPEPRNLRPDFEAMLAEFKEEKAQKPNLKLGNWQRWVAAACILLVGGLAGVFFQKNVLNKNSEVAQLGNEVHELKQMMMLTLIENPTATERMRAVNLCQELPNVDQKVLDALFTTLNTDENDNVRLVTLDALVQMAHIPKVREGLVASLLKQESPLVQVALADAMVQIQEKKSVKSLKELLQKKGLDKSVKEKYEKTIQVLI